MNGNCYTYLLILSEVSINDPAFEDDTNQKEILLHLLDYALINDDDFIEEYKQTTLFAIYVHQKAALKAL